jgi:long-chain fatty acid transport protein
MRTVRTVTSSSKLMSASSLALAALTSAASAGGFALNEQSTVFMGSASAGAAAGGSIGSMYWNPAATAALPGLNTESSYFLILPQADVHVNGGDSGGNVGIDAATARFLMA